MKRLILIACISGLAVAQQIISIHVRPGVSVEVTSESKERDGRIYHLAGHVVIKTNVMTIRTENVDYNDETATFTSYGETTIELK
jgi:hypothetical protein